MEMKTLRDALPEQVAKGILNLLQLRSWGKEHFSKKYKLLNANAELRRGSFGKVYQVISNENDIEYAIKKVVVSQESTQVVYDMFLQALQECEIPNHLGCHDNLIRAHPKLNWIVLPDDLDGADVIEMLEKGLNMPLSSLRRFIGTEVYMVFDWYLDDLHDVMQCSYDGSEVAVIKREDSRQILLHILFGLYFLHQKGVIHNDVKPNNVLLKHYQHEYHQLQAVVADLGLACYATSGLATTRHRVKRHMYDAPDPKFSTSIDIWSFGLLAIHLIFVANTQKRMLPSEFEQLTMWAREKHFHSLRKFVRQKLTGENPFLVESLVQCLHIDPPFRPTARVLRELLVGGELYVSACEAARTLHQLLGRGCHHVCLEEMIFPHWYECVFLVAIIKSKEVPKETVAVLVRFGNSEHFPLAAVVAYCEPQSENLQLFANILVSSFSSTALEA